MLADGLMVLPQATLPVDFKFQPESLLELSGSHAMACAPGSDTSSGPVPTLTADAVPNLTIVPVSSLNSVSLAAAAAVAGEKQQLSGSFAGPQLQAQLEALRNRRRLLFTQAPTDCTEYVIKAWLSQFGTVEQLQMYGENGAVIGSNCGLVTMGTSEAAAAVVAAVLGNMQLPPAFQKLSVNWVLQSDEHGIVSSDGHVMPTSLAANADRTIFFAKVPPTALASEVESLFGSFGKLAEVNLFRAWAGAKHSKGCGLITYKDRGSAGAAIQQLHGEYTFPGSDCPMVVEWMDLKKQRPAAVLPAVDKAPMGCAPDAFKLLLSNIPVSISESALISALSQFGHVVQLGLSQDPAGPCASGFLWYSSKHAADNLLNRSKAEPVWLRDARTGHDMAMSVKRSRRPGFNSGCSTTTSRVNVMGFNSSAHPPSSASNSSSSYLPMLHSQLAGFAAHHSQELHSTSQQLAAAAAGLGSGSLDPYAMLQNANVMRLLPMQQGNPALMGPAAAVMLQGNGTGSNYTAHDVCEAMLDYGDMSGLNMGMPVHLQPAMAAQMATHLARSSLPGLQPRQMANSQVCCIPAAKMMGNNSGQHCLSSPANIQADEFEGSFSMPALRGNSANMLGNGRLASMPAQQQLMAQQLQQQQQQQLQLQQQQQQLQQQQLQQATAASSSGFKSIVVPINGYEVQLIAEHLSFFASQSGAQVTITFLQGTGLAVMISGQHEQVAMAQTLLASARGHC